MKSRIYDGFVHWMILGSPRKCTREPLTNPKAEAFHPISNGGTKDLHFTEQLKSTFLAKYLWYERFGSPSELCGW